MKREAARAGYTIVETMIFLAVSGALFLSTMLLMGGQQRKTQFATTVRDFDTKLQSVISNVATGYYYNSTGNTTCDISSGFPVVTSGGTTGQGQASDCTFIGQVIVPSATGITIYSTAGLRRAGTPARDVARISEARPTLITATAENYNLDNGVRILSMKRLPAPTQDFNALATFTTFNPYSSSGLTSGSSRSDIYAIRPADPAGIQAALAADPPSDLTTPNPNSYDLNPPDGVQICLIGGEQRAKIILNNGSTNLTIGNSSICS